MNIDYPICLFDSFSVFLSTEQACAELMGSTWLGHSKQTYTGPMVFPYQTLTGFHKLNPLSATVFSE